MNTRTAILLPLVLLVACGSNSSSLSADEQPATVRIGQKQDLAGLSTAHFAAGCFWCVEEVFESVKGVKEVVSGYSGGTESNPTYEAVSRGQTSHAEAVEVYYDPKVVSYATLLKVFFASQDPTTPDRQGPDAGTQYRSIAFFNTPERKAQIEAYIKQLNASGQYDRPIVTQVVPFEKFWPAEAYHQDFVKRNPDDRYVRGVSKPRFERFKAKMPEVLK
ncbi:MAG: peptide-methionine (S)-S-oxide reductase MsrA [Flavobacteriales bacterium]|nr:peptide-methionine (S)-S-oxide reductase MsrA [Flavobacteriales bacterium]MCB0758927.1 peptide-methionine (S)-S-oxide reductase MsrA [Flavobacteriales bacterium]